MKPLPYLLAWFSGLPSQKWIWPSTMKYRSPSFSYTLRPPLLSDRLQIEAQEFGGVFRVGEKQGALVEVDHRRVVGGPALFALSRGDKVGCGDRGCRGRGGVMGRCVHWSTFPCRVCLFSSPCSSSLTSMPNMSTV